MRYETWLCSKVDEHSAKLPLSTTRCIPDGVPIGWEHFENDVNRPRRFAIFDFVPASKYNKDCIIAYYNF